MSQNDPNRSAAPEPPEEGASLDQHTAQEAAANEKTMQGAIEGLEAADSAPEPEPEAAIESLQVELREATDRALRAHAELDNYRKRMNRLMEEERRYAAIDLIRDLLPVWDNMGRAIAAAEQTHDTSSLLQGLHVMHDQLLTVLERHNCKRIEAMEKPFDPHLHEAISQQPSTDFDPNTIMHVAQEGFLLHDRVVRPTQVVLATKPPGSAES